MQLGWLKFILKERLEGIKERREKEIECLQKSVENRRPHNFFLQIIFQFINKI